MASTTTGSAPSDALRERAGDLRSQLSDLRRRIDLQGRITAHPLPAIGIALAVGAVVGMRRRPEPVEVEASVGFRGAVTGALTAIALRMLRDVALRQLSGAARTWYGKRRDLHGGPPSERRGSFDHDVGARPRH